MYYEVYGPIFNRVEQALDMPELLEKTVAELAKGHSTRTLWYETNLSIRNI